MSSKEHFRAVQLEGCIASGFSPEDAAKIVDHAIEVADGLSDQIERSGDSFDNLSASLNVVAIVSHILLPRVAQMLSMMKQAVDVQNAKPQGSTIQ